MKVRGRFPAAGCQCVQLSTSAKGPNRSSLRLEERNLKEKLNLCFEMRRPPIVLLGSLCPRAAISVQESTAGCFQTPIEQDYLRGNSELEPTSCHDSLSNRLNPAGVSLETVLTLSLRLGWPWASFAITGHELFSHLKKSRPIENGKFRNSTRHRFFDKIEERDAISVMSRILELESQ